METIFNEDFVNSKKICSIVTVREFHHPDSPPIIASGGQNPSVRDGFVKRVLHSQKLLKVIYNQKL